MDTFKTNQTSISSQISVKYFQLFIIKIQLSTTKTQKLNQSAILLITQQLKIITSSQELTLKFLSSRLNVKPYNKLSKKVGDFKDNKGELEVPYITKSSRQQDRTDYITDKEYKIYIQHQKLNKYYKTNAYLQKYTQNKRKVGNWIEL